MASSTAAGKRNLDKAEIVQSNPSKKRKLNEDESNTSSTAQAQSEKSSNSEPVIPFPPPSTNNNKNTDKVASSATNVPHNGTKAKPDVDDNQNPQKWSFKASDFTFGDNNWVNQTSDPNSPKTENSTTATTTKTKEPQKEVLTNTNTTDSFSGFVGLGFGKELESKKEENATEKGSEKTEESKKDNPWEQNWSNSNADGSFS